MDETFEHTVDGQKLQLFERVCIKVQIINHHP